MKGKFIIFAKRWSVWTTKFLLGQSKSPRKDVVIALEGKYYGERISHINKFWSVPVILRSLQHVLAYLCVAWYRYLYRTWCAPIWAVHFIHLLLQRPYSPFMIWKGAFPFSPYVSFSFKEIIELFFTPIMFEKYFAKTWCVWKEYFPFTYTSYMRTECRKPDGIFPVACIIMYTVLRYQFPCSSVLFKKAYCMLYCFVRTAKLYACALLLVRAILSAFTA